MRLLHTIKYTLHEVAGNRTPLYAILSHRWEGGEVSFSDLESGNGNKKRGWGKIVGCCKKALGDGFEYIWIDSCCIDKSSSAELSEAINSMYQWYETAQICYAYLSDVPSKDIRHGRVSRAFQSSQWFTRGWTLQELLAPETVVFYDQDWNEIGTKSSLEHQISTITGINDLFGFKSKCIAVKMSWAAKRETTRVEDQAYCLMGIFGVNMPTLYGEGRKAFYRLQLEIMSKTTDDSIFAWWIRLSIHEGRGLLAPSPAAFAASGEVGFNTTTANPRVQSPFSMTNKGLRMDVNLIPMDVPGGGQSLFINETFGLPLNCCRGAERQEENPRYCILYLKRRRVDDNLYYRTRDEPQTTGIEIDYSLENPIGKIGGSKRETIYVEQGEFYTPKWFPSVFLIDARYLMRDGFLAQTDLFNESFTNFWIKADTIGLKIGVHRTEHLFHQSDAVLLFKNATEAFALIIRAPYWTVVEGTDYEGKGGLGLLVPQKGQALKDFVRSLSDWKFMRKDEFGERRVDYLQSGLQVQVELRKKVAEDGAFYLVNLLLSRQLNFQTKLALRTPRLFQN